MGINSFGFGGANVHVIVTTCNHEQNLPNDNKIISAHKTNLPRLLVAAARTQESVKQITTEMQPSLTKFEKGIIAIFHELSKESLVTHPTRGFIIPECDVSEVKEHQVSLISKHNHLVMSHSHVTLTFTTFQACNEISEYIFVQYRCIIID